MYNTMQNVKDIHIVSKIFSLIFYTAGVIILQNPWFFFLYAVIFYFFFRSIRMLLLEVLLTLMIPLSPIFLIVLKFIFILSGLVLFIKTIDLGEIRYFIECVSYRKKYSKIGSSCLFICYFLKYYFYYFKEFIMLKNSYGKTISFASFKYMLIQSFFKTKAKISNIFLIYQYRFYRSNSSRTYVEKPMITSMDLKYVLIFVIQFLFVFVYGG